MSKRQNSRKRCIASTSQVCITKKAKPDLATSDVETFLSNIASQRIKTSVSISNFKFNKKRIRVLSHSEDVLPNCEGVVYWMSRDQRVQDNWAFLYAQRLALKIECPLYICFCLVPKFLDATIRQFEFMLKGLKEVEEECGLLEIPFILLFGQAVDVLPQFIMKHNIGALVTDFSPLRTPLSWIEYVKEKLPPTVPFCQVDAHNIVPCWMASDKLEYAARTIRGKITNKLPEYLTEFPPVIRHPHLSHTKFPATNWNAAIESLEVDRTVDAVDWAKPGTRAGLTELFSFCSERLKHFADFRNNPTKNQLSNLSPWIHFGQISVQRCILGTQEYKNKFIKSVDVYFEEAVIRRELADNFCFYCPNYDNLKGAWDWARKTLNDHKGDKREYVYSSHDLEKALTHDPLWNAAQLQMVQEGKMHGFLRMYWAKKILEWTKSPEDALAIAICLNDKYQLDGRDPNGYVGCMWSICGVHDQGWAERMVFGKIRYMNLKGCQRKFDVSEFIQRYKSNFSKLPASTE